MPYWRSFFHLVWATKGRAPLLTAEIEQGVYAHIKHKANAQGGIPYAVNGMPDHVHVVTAIPPSMAVADFVKNLKGASSRYVHLEYGVPFAWQTGYGVFSVDGRGMKDVMAYVERQKQHHADGTLITWLERSTADSDGPGSARGF